MADYKTPGVYVEEQNSFGSSIVANETAIPVFIGFTEAAIQSNGHELDYVKESTSVRVPVLVSSMLEYENSFDGADTTGTQCVTTAENGNFASTIQKNGKNYTPGLVYPSVSNYFSNGGGSCYIISLGSYNDFSEDDTSPVDIASIKEAIEIAETATLILATDLIRYGAENYYNWITQLTDYCQEEKRYFCVADVVQENPEDSTLNDKDIEAYRNEVTPKYTSYAAAYYPYLRSLTSYAYSEDNVTLDGVELTDSTIDEAKRKEVEAYLNKNYINMPPSPFMAGIYSRLDNATGVWTPPANTSPTGVTGPVVSITNREQENLNVDAIAGKSINAIRSFTGKGTLVWGARTNDGNSLDWRYINVRRLFISMETDISMALEAYVFKPNVHNTWVEVKTMIESYLYGLFTDGAFAGTTPETSYQVLIGVGETMTDEDVLNGYMRVSIQVAPVRPAEFIVLTFSQMVGQ